MSTVTPIRPGTSLMVAGEIKAWMGRRGVNQTQLAAALGMKQSAVSKRLRGRIIFNIEELAAAAEFLGCEVSDLIPQRRSWPPSPHPSSSANGKSGGKYAIRDSNSEPADLRHFLTNLNRVA